MKILVFSASGPPRRRSTKAARTQSLNLRPEAGPAAAAYRGMGLAAPTQCYCGGSRSKPRCGTMPMRHGIAEMIGQRPA